MPSPAQKVDWPPVPKIKRHRSRSRHANQLWRRGDSTLMVLRAAKTSFSELERQWPTEHLGKHARSRRRRRHGARIMCGFVHPATEMNEAHYLISTTTPRLTSHARHARNEPLRESSCCFKVQDVSYIEPIMLTTVLAPPHLCLKCINPFSPLLPLSL